MSIISAGCFGDAALVATDSYVLGADAPGIGGCSKINTLVWQRAVIASRGAAILHHRLLEDCNRSGLTLDDLAIEMPSLILRAGARLAGVLSSTDWCEETDVVLAGWSEARHLPLLFGYHQDAPGGEIQVITGEAGRHCVFAPWDVGLMGAVPVLGDIASVEGIIRIAYRQKRAMDARFPPKGAGGKLIVAQVLRDETTIAHVWDLDLGEEVFATKAAATAAERGTPAASPSSEPHHAAEEEPVS